MMEDKVCYIIKCKVEDTYYDDKHQIYFIKKDYYLTDQIITFQRKKFRYLSENLSNVKKFYALNIAETIKKKLKRVRFAHKNVINSKVIDIEITTPKKEGFIACVPNFSIVPQFRV